MLHLTSESLDCVLNTPQSPGRIDQTNWQVKLQPPQVAYFQDLKCWGTWASACSQDHHTNDSSEERSWTQSMKDEIGPSHTGPALGPLQVQHWWNSPTAGSEHSWLYRMFDLTTWWSSKRCWWGPRSQETGERRSLHPVLCIQCHHLNGPHHAGQQRSPFLEEGNVTRWCPQSTAEIACMVIHGLLDTNVSWTELNSTKPVRSVYCTVWLMPRSLAGVPQIWGRDPVPDLKANRSNGGRSTQRPCQWQTIPVWQRDFNFKDSRSE